MMSSASMNAEIRSCSSCFATLLPSVTRREGLFHRPCIALSKDRRRAVGRARKVVIDLAISLPALFAGSMLGIIAFRNINEIGFRRTILIVLLFSGASLAFA
jgi:hypothetical protein